MKWTCLVSITDMCALMYNVIKWYEYVKNEHMMWICGICTTDMNRVKDWSIIHVEMWNRHDLCINQESICFNWYIGEGYASICYVIKIYCHICWYMLMMIHWPMSDLGIGANMWNLCNGDEYVIYVLWIWICDIHAMDMNTRNMCNWYECDVMLEIYG